MKVAHLVTAMEEIAPLRFAEEWDNVGLLAGDPEAEVRRVLLCIDYTSSVAEEAERLGCGAVIAYHPPIFGALKRIAHGTPLAGALRRGVALYSPHTALDVAPGGTNDVLADIVGMAEERAPLRLVPAKDVELKLVTFVPEDALDRVSDAIFAAGAGRIGKYVSCSFRTSGTGTFFGEEGAKPAVGEPGRLETSAEVKVETVLPLAHAPAVVRALRAAHPYEEPAFDLVRLATPPEGKGMGRIGPIAPADRRGVIERVKRGLGVERVLVAGPRSGGVSRVAVAAGAAGDLLGAAVQQGAHLVVTGEIRHHDALAAAAAGVTVVCALHSNSERVTLRHLRERLARAVPAEVAVSEVDADPFVFG